MMDLTWIEGTIAAVSATLGGVVTFFANRKKRTADDKKSQQDAILTMQQTIDNMAQRIVDQYGKLDKVLEENANFRAEITQLKAENRQLIEKVDKLTKIIEKSDIKCYL